MPPTDSQSLSASDWLRIGFKAFAGLLLLALGSVAVCSAFVAMTFISCFPLAVAAVVAFAVLFSMNVVPDEFGWMLAIVPGFSVVLTASMMIVRRPVSVSFLAVALLAWSSWGFFAYNSDDVKISTKIAWVRELAQLQEGGDCEGRDCDERGRQERAAELGAKLAPFRADSWDTELLALTIPFTPNEELTTLYFWLWSRRLTEYSFTPWRAGTASMRAAAPAVGLITYVFLAGILALGIRDLWPHIGNVLEITADPAFKTTASDDLGCDQSAVRFLLVRFTKAFAVSALSVASSGADLGTGVQFAVEVGTSALVTLSSSALLDLVGVFVMGFLIRCAVPVERVIWDQLVVIAIGALLGLAFQAAVSDVVLGLLISTVPIVVAHSWRRRSAGQPGWAQ